MQVLCEIRIDPLIKLSGDVSQILMNPNAKSFPGPKVHDLAPLCNLVQR